MTFNFQNQLKQLTFTTFHQNQLATFDFDDLFNNRRVIVFSITQIYTKTSLIRAKTFNKLRQHFKQYNIDDIYLVDSSDWSIGPWANIHVSPMIGLPDRDTKFVEYVANYANVSKPINNLARLWQYTIIINNGIPEKLWHNPFKVDMPLTLLKDPRYRYRGVGPEQVEEYLLDNTK